MADDAPSEPVPVDHRAELAKVIPRRPAVSWWLGLILAAAFAALVTPAITAEHWLLRFTSSTITANHEAPFTVRAPMFSGDNLRTGGGVVIARGDIATRDEAAIASALAANQPDGTAIYLALFALTFALTAVFSHHMRRSIRGRLVRVQVTSLASIAALAIAVKIILLSTALSVLVVPVAVLASVPTMALDRTVGLATGVLAALIISLLGPFDVGLSTLLLVQAATTGLVLSERKRRWIATLLAGAAATLCTAAMYLLLTYLSTGHAAALTDPLHSAWVAAAFGPALAAVIAVPLLPLYQIAVGEITQARLYALEDLGNPLLRRIAAKSPGTWQHSLTMANLAEIAANAIGANGRLVRVGAYYHDLGKSLQAKYFIENLEPGEPSPHDQLLPEVSCDAIFAHVTEGIVFARKSGLHERIVDFMHMHHGNGVLEYFWAKCQQQGNPRGLTIEQFRYPGYPPQSRETAILTICDAVEAASRTLRTPEPQAIEALVQRIVFGKLHLGQLDESGLSMADLRRISDSLRETIRHANHGRIEYPWQRANDVVPPASTAFETPVDGIRKPMTAAMAAAGSITASGPIAVPSAPVLAAGTAPTMDDPNAAVAAVPTARPPTESDADRPSLDSERHARPPRSDIAARELGRAKTGTERWLPSAKYAPATTAAPARELTTAPGRAPAPIAEPVDAASEADAFDATTSPGHAPLPVPVSAKAPPPLAEGSAARDPLSTAPGRAPGPMPVGSRPIPLVESPAVHDADYDAMSIAPGPAPAAGRPIAPVAPVMLEPRRPPQPAPPIAGARNEVRAIGSMPPANADPSATLPTQLVISPPPSADPAQLAQVLASIVSRAGSSAGATDEVDAALTQPLIASARPAPSAVAKAPDTQPLRSKSARPDADSALTQPMVKHADLDGEWTDSADPAPAVPPVDDVDTEIVQPALTPIRVAPRAPTGAPAAPLRTSGLVDDRAQSIKRGEGAPRLPGARESLGDDKKRVPDTWRGGHGVGRQPVTMRGRPMPSEAPVDVSESPFDDDAKVTVRRIQPITVDAAPTEPSLPSHSSQWATGLAARIDAALDGDEWSLDTPVVAPTKAELRNLLGRPDPTRQMSVDEVVALQRQAAELIDDPPRRSPHPTAEVDPDDIEAAIELAPPARRPAHVNAIGVAKRGKPAKKPE